MVLSAQTLRRIETWRSDSKIRVWSQKMKKRLTADNLDEAKRVIREILGNANPCKVVQKEATITKHQITTPIRHLNFQVPQPVVI